MGTLASTRPTLSTTGSHGRLGERLVAANLLEPPALDRALSLQRSEGGYLTDILVSARLVEEKPLLEFLARDAGIKFITADRLSRCVPPGDLKELFPVREAERLCVLPLRLDAPTHTLTVIVPDCALGLLDEVRKAASAEEILPLLSLHRSIRSGIQRFYHSDLYAFEAIVRAETTAKVTPSGTGKVVLRAPAQQGGVPTPLDIKAPEKTKRSAEIERLKEALERERRENKLLRVAHQLHAHLARERNLAELVHRVLAFAFDNLPADDGVFLLPDSESRLTPCAARTRRKEANAEVLVSASLLREVERTKQAVLTGEAARDPRFSGSGTVATTGIRSMMGVPIVFGGKLRGALTLVAKGGGAFSPFDLEILNAIAGQASIAVENLMLTRRATSDAEVRARLSRFLSPALVELASSGALNLSEGGQQQPCTILFADIRGFTSMAERMPAQSLVALLNEHFEAMVDVVFSQGGVLDKFVGDALMALWGVPLQRPDDARRAIDAALEMIDRVAKMNERRLASGREQLQVGIGVDSGSVVFGAIGASRRQELTVVGDAVNTASRISGVAGAGELVISERTLVAAGGGAGLTVEALPPAKLKGKAQQTLLYRVRRP
jgi:adenylate cyclase